MATQDPIIDVIYTKWLQIYSNMSYSYDTTIMHRYPVGCAIIPFGAIFIYGILLILIPKIMEKRERFRLKWVSFFWNTFLCVLSVCMVLGLAVPTMKEWSNRGGIFSSKAHWDYICNGAKSEHIMGIVPSEYATWVYVFAWSKFFELFDTVILMLKKREVIFLHWYHHMSVLVMTWFLVQYRVQIGTYFAIMNGTVHAFLYYYYAMASLGYRPSWGKHLTTIQILQMVVGTVINITWTYSLYYARDEGCKCFEHCGRMFVGTAIMYASYGFLFIRYFVNRWILKKEKKA